MEVRVGTETDTSCLDISIVPTSPPQLTMLSSVEDFNPMDTIVVEETACFSGGYLLTEWVAIERNGM